MYMLSLIEIPTLDEVWCQQLQMASPEWRPMGLRHLPSAIPAPSSEWLHVWLLPVACDKQRVALSFGDDTRACCRVRARNA